MNTAESPSKSNRIQIVLYLVMSVALVLGIWIRLLGAGWFLVCLGLPLIIIAILHLMFQISAIRRISKMKPSYIPLILLSNLFFFLGFSLQIDFGDQGGGYLAIVAFYDFYFNSEARSYVNGNTYLYLFISLGFLVALIVSWILLLGKLFIKQKNST